MVGHASSGATATKFSDFHDRVGIVSWDYGENARGGLGRAIAEMMETLREQGVSVEVFAPRYWLLVPRSSCIVFVWCFLRRWIARYRIQAVLLPTGPGGLFLFRKPKRCRLIVVSYHTYWQQARMVPGQWWKRIFVPLERRTLHLADCVLCYSKDTERVLLQQYDVPQAKLALLPQLLDVAAWSFSLPPTTYHLQPKESGLCVFIGRLDRRKGISILLRAWVLLQTYQYTSILIHLPRLVIVGNGRLRRRTDRMIARLPSVSRVPSLPQEELVRLVQRAEIVVCPSYLEGFGLACAAAMAAGTAVVASDCDGLRSLIRHGETGWLVPPGDPVALADGIITLLRDVALRERMTESAYAYIRRSFGRQESTQQFLATFQESPVSSASCAAGLCVRW